MPFLTILARPNGSGKSTLTGKLRFEDRENLLDPDAIAKRLNPPDPAKAAVAAAREAIVRTREYLRTGTSFGIETTLSGGGYLETMRVARDRGFVVRPVYICVGNPEKKSSACVRGSRRVGTMYRIMTSGDATSEAWRICPRRCGWPTRRGFMTMPGMSHR